MENHELESVVAAILTAGSFGGTNSSVEAAVSRYKAIIDQLRAAGGTSHPASLCFGVQI